MKPVIFFILFAVIGLGCESPRSNRAMLVSNPTLGGQFDIPKIDLSEGDSFGEGWKMIDADTTGGLEVDIIDFREFQLVNLPHRILKPNEPIWYQKKIKIEKKGVLNISADDGAQVWANEERCQHLEGNFFRIDPKQDSTTLTIRVMNNAMQGGLRKVTFIPEEDWEEYVQENDSLHQHHFSTSIFVTDPIWQKSGDGNFMRWISENAENAEIQWGYDSTQIDQVIKVSSESNIFQAEFPSVEKRIYYQIEQGNTISRSFTKPYQPSNDTTTFAAWGDSQGGWKIFQQLIEQMNEHQPSFSVGAGDLVSHGHDEYGYQLLIQSLSAANFHHYLIPGNHDYDGFYEDLNPDHYFAYLGLPDQKQYFSWQEGHCAFIALDPNMTFPISIESDQLDWFKEQLELPFWREASWRFLVLHQPPLSQGWPGYHGEEKIYELLLPHFENGEIDVVIAGHSHDYERVIKDFDGNKVAFIVTGGGGGGIEPSGLSDWPVMDTVIKQHHFGIFKATENELLFKAYNLEKELMDRVKLDRKLIGIKPT